MDHTLSEVVNQGIFIGVNEFGHAQLKQEDGMVNDVFEGRMRQLLN